MMAALSRWRDTNAPSGGLISEQPITAHTASNERKSNTVQNNFICFRLTGAAAAAATLITAHARTEYGRHDCIVKRVRMSPVRDLDR